MVLEIATTLGSYIAGPLSVGCRTALIVQRPSVSLKASAEDLHSRSTRRGYYEGSRLEANRTRNHSGAKARYPPLYASSATKPKRKRLSMRYGAAAPQNLLENLFGPWVSHRTPSGLGAYRNMGFAQSRRDLRPSHSRCPMYNDTPLATLKNMSTDPMMRLSPTSLFHLYISHATRCLGHHLLSTVSYLQHTGTFHCRRMTPKGTNITTYTPTTENSSVGVES